MSLDFSDAQASLAYAVTLLLAAHDQRDIEFGPELGPNCLQMLSADDSRLQAKKRFMHSSDQLVPSYACTCKSPSYPFLCLVVNIYKLTNKS